MTKRREPHTVEDALDQAIGLVGVEQVAAWLAKSVGWVRKCADPDDDGRHLRMVDGLVIDRHLCAAGHPQVFGELFETVCAHNRVGGVEAVAPGARPLVCAVSVMGRAADLVEQVQTAEGDGVVDRHEQVKLLAAYERLQKMMAPLRRALARKAVPA